MVVVVLFSPELGSVHCCRPVFFIASSFPSRELRSCESGTVLLLRHVNRAQRPQFAAKLWFFFKKEKCDMRQGGTRVRCNNFLPIEIAAIRAHGDLSVVHSAVDYVVRDSWLEVLLEMARENPVGRRVWTKGLYRTFPRTLKT